MRAPGMRDRRRGAERRSREGVAAMVAGGLAVASLPAGVTLVAALAAAQGGRRLARSSAAHSAAGLSDERAVS